MKQHSNKAKLAALAIATSFLAACGGGGDETVSNSPAVDMSILNGSDAIRGSYTNSCTGSGTDLASVQVTTNGNAATLKFVSGSETMTYQLTYLSGNNTSGFNFSGIATYNGLTSTVNTATLKNTGTAGTLNLLADINATDRGCTVTQHLVHRSDVNFCFNPVTQVLSAC